MSIKFLGLGAGVFWVLGGWEVPILFLWARGFFCLLLKFRRVTHHHPRGTTLREALRGNLPLRGFLGASAAVSSRVVRGSAGVHGIFRG